MGLLLGYALSIWPKCMQEREPKLCLLFYFRFKELGLPANVLQIVNVSTSDAGNYICQASNDFGQESTSSSAHLAVHLGEILFADLPFADCITECCTNLFFSRFNMFSCMHADAFILPKPMMHVAYSPISVKFINSPYFCSSLFLGLPPYVDHDAFMHYALHVLDAPVVLDCSSFR